MMLLLRLFFGGIVCLIDANECDDGHKLGNIFNVFWSKLRLKGWGQLPEAWTRRAWDLFVALCNSYVPSV